MAARKIYESTKRAHKRFEAEHYDMIGTRVKKGERARIKAYAEAQGISLNSFCKNAIYTAMGESSSSLETAEADNEQDELKKDIDKNN